MRDRREPWKWPVAIGLAVSLMLTVAFWLPRSWLGFLLSGGDSAAVVDSGPGGQWLTLLPPPPVGILEAQADLPQADEAPLRQPLAEDPRWWREGWAVDTARDETLFAPPAAALDDTVRLLLGGLGLGVDFMTRARPDSILAARLFLMQLEDGFRYDELKPYLSSLARARAYADIMSRAADMYDEHLRQEIQVPD